ncbi:MAG TPA: phosphotransferase [Kofleriaceae bacterium]|jgi:tRNA A-37 threonylcarbamoyl transferase component Bud32
MRRNRSPTKSFQDQPPAGSGNGRLAVGALAMAPVLAASYAQAAIARRRFATPAGARRALEELAMRETVVSVTPLGTGKSNAVSLVTLGSRDKVVLKKALPFGTMMAWGARHFGANFIYAQDTTGIARITRESEALTFLHEHGVDVPRLIAASPRHELLAIEFIDGEPAATALYGAEGMSLACEVGALFRRVHDVGVTLADGHPGNMLLERATGRIVLFDLEFAEIAGATPARRGFDLAYASVLLPSPEHVESMLSGYGPRTAEDEAAARIAEAHLRRFSQLLEMERARWRPTQ